MASSMQMCSSCPKQSLVNLDECERAGELVGVPEVFDEEVNDGNGFCSSCDSDAPLPGL